MASTCIRGRASGDFRDGSVAAHAQLSYKNEAPTSRRVEKRRPPPEAEKAGPPSPVTEGTSRLGRGWPSMVKDALRTWAVADKAKRLVKIRGTKAAARSRGRQRRRRRRGPAAPASDMSGGGALEAGPASEAAERRPHPGVAQLHRSAEPRSPDPRRLRPRLQCASRGRAETHVILGSSLRGGTRSDQQPARPGATHRAARRHRSEPLSQAERSVRCRLLLGSQPSGARGAGIAGYIAVARAKHPARRRARSPAHGCWPCSASSSEADGAAAMA
jgi:hypothetical protein